MREGGAMTTAVPYTTVRETLDECVKILRRHKHVMIAGGVVPGR